MWTNAFPRWAPHGLRLDDLRADQRARALVIVQASLSVAGFTEGCARTVARNSWFLPTGSASRRSRGLICCGRAAGAG
jgi:hypothetical protein